MNDIIMARTSLFRQPASQPTSQPASPPAFANLITSFFLRKTWLIKSNDSNYCVTRSSQSLAYIIPCFSNDRSKCSKLSNMCQQHRSRIGVYSLKHFPYDSLPFKL
ncbi:hypothetical protein DPMN_099215 [Dreissena polymorpha]|uniref:Uncharacterized protein n=1 Tax=Dreissena polymorpha TaxID=45954 RepID=A0A9D4LF71_DREPO|nr:hypothetical protein DPMN_099215 [Dreissena polymorpha]